MTDRTEQAERQDVIHALAASPDLHLCLGARPSGLYRSEDGGLTWHDAYSSLKLQTPLPTVAVVLSPDFATDRTVFAGVPGGILRSADGGHTWTAVQLPSPPPFVYSLAVSPHYAQDGVVLAGTMEEAVRLAATQASSGEVVLLSPGCASFGQFRDFMDRGEQFRAAVKRLEESEA